MNGSSLVAPRLPKFVKSASTPGLPWGTSITAVCLTLIACARITQSGTFFTDVNVFSTVLVLISVTIGVVFYPWHTIRIFFCLYPALRLFAMTGMLGYHTASYAGLIIAAAVARRNSLARRAIPELPGAHFLLLFAALVTLQFIRATDFRDSLPILFDVITFAFVLWRLSEVSNRFYRACVEGFVVGVVVVGFLMFIQSADPTGRLGLEFGFNPNELGNLVGAGLLFTASGEFFKNKRWLLWVVIPLLLLLLLATGSRTSIYAGFACIGILLSLRNSRVFWALLICGSIALGYLTYRGVSDTDPDSLSGRVASPLTESFDESSAHRAVIWGFLLTQVPNYWKWGIGLGNTENLTEEVGILSIPDVERNVRIGYQSHNIYLTIALEFGILGLLLFVAWQASIIQFALRQRPRCALLLTTMLFFIFQGFFQGQNLNFVHGFLLLVAYTVSKGSQRPATLPT